jgi:16S rRNA (cytosine967-C5)-methyltransferase
MESREIALQVLYKVDVEQGFSNIVLDQVLENQSVSDLDKAFITELVYGVISRKLTLDYIISKNSKIKPNKISPWIHNILRMGIYQVCNLDKVPVSAACNESVKLARKYGHQASAGFVNAIMRNISRNPNQLEGLESLPQIERISILYSHPKWLVEKWTKQYGAQFTEKLCEANNQRPRTAIRVNALKTGVQEVKRMLEEIDVSTVQSNYVSEALVLKKGSPMNQIYKDGFYTVQDEAAMLVSEALNPTPGQTIADVCAAPGGKTTHIAQLMQNKGRIIAMDIHEHRVELIKKTAQRLGINIIDTKAQDATVLDQSLVDQCDGVLVDAPCSGFGVLRRKPEIKWDQDKQDLKDLRDLQAKILMTASKYVKTKGRLVYSTCTLNQDENENIVQSFLKENKDFVLEPVKFEMFQIENEGMVTLYPNIHGMDGFFISVIKRR